MTGMNLFDWIFDYLLPIFIDQTTLTNTTMWGHSLRELLAFWFVCGLFFIPALAIYFAIKKGRRLL